MSAFLLPALAAVGQNAPAAAPAAEAPSSCAALAATDIPLNTVLQAKVTGLMSASRLKPGKEIWVNSVYGMVFAGCQLDANAAIYGQVMSAASTKNPNASEISLQFNKVDCMGQPKKDMSFFLIGVLAPPEDDASGHDAMPTEVSGGTRRISDTVASTVAYDAKLNPGGPPHTVRPGVVIGMKKLKLDVQGGPSCSAKMSSTDRNIELEPGTVLLLALRQTK
jgi:hypothetical protein